MPLGVDGYLKPSDPALASKLGALGFEHYSCHVPRGTGPLACVRWAQAMREAFDAEGMTFAVEIDWVGSGRFLSEYHEVAGFLLAVRDDWEQPFVIDCAHLHINESSGWWTPSQVDEILAADAAIEVHFSANNGRKDIHGELRPGRHPRIWEMLESINLSTVRYLVDEGRVGR